MEQKTEIIENGVKTKRCPHCDKNKPFSEFCKGGTKEGLASWCKGCSAESTRRWQRANPEAAKRWRKDHPHRARELWRKHNNNRTPESKLFAWAKHRAKVDNLPFSISLSDIVIPEFCPVLGVRLKIGHGKCHSTSPTLDRFVPESGYVVGNISVISLKANNIKSNGTISELESVLYWMKSRLK